MVRALFTFNNRYPQSHHYRTFYHQYSELCHIPIRLHQTGELSLNKGYQSTRFMISLLTLTGIDSYEAFFALNRQLYCKFIQI